MAVLYQNNDGNIIDWVEFLDNNGVCSLVDDGDQQKLEAINPPTNSYGRYVYDNAVALTTWTDYEFSFALGWGTEVPWYFFFMVRGTAAGTGILFEKNPLFGSWLPRGPSWNIIKNANQAINNGDTIKVQITGVDAAAVLRIFRNGELVFHGDSPNAFKNVGTIGLGIVTYPFGPKPTMHFTFDNLLVADPPIVHVANESMGISDQLHGQRILHTSISERDTPKVFQVKWRPRVFGVDERRR